MTDDDPACCFGSGLDFFLRNPRKPSAVHNQQRLHTMRITPDEDLKQHAPDPAFIRLMDEREAAIIEAATAYMAELNTEMPEGGRNAIMLCIHDLIAKAHAS